jgi:hypothetical protein
VGSPPLVRDEPTTLWEIRHHGRLVEAVARLTQVGIDIVVDGTAIFGQTFPDQAAALAFTESERLERVG